MLNVFACLRRALKLGNEKRRLLHTLVKDVRLLRGRDCAQLCVATPPSRRKAASSPPESSLDCHHPMRTQEPRSATNAHILWSLRPVGTDRDITIPEHGEKLGLGACFSPEEVMDMFPRASGRHRREGTSDDRREQEGDIR